MGHEAVRTAARASRRAVALALLGIASLTAAALVPAALAVPAAWKPGVAAPVPPPPRAEAAAPRTVPSDKAIPSDDAVPGGPVHAGGSPWRPPLAVEPCGTVAPGLEAVARPVLPRVFLHPGAPLQGVLHGLAPPAPSAHA